MERKEWIGRMVECLSTDIADPTLMGEAIDLKYEHRPKSLFKYRALYDKGYAIENLEKDFVWISSPTAYNDPYDSSISIASEELIEGIIRFGVKRMLEDELKNKISDASATHILESKHPDLALQEFVMSELDDLPQEQRLAFGQWLEDTMVQQKLQFKAVLPESHKSSLKLCSFSETPDSIIMWSHYANQHQGFCIEYGVEELPPDHLFVRMMFPVIYSEKLFDATPYYQAMMVDRTKFNQLFPALAALHKSPEWSYEREWRLVIPANMVKEDSIWRVPKPKIVYMGTRISESHRLHLIELCKRRDIEVRQMRLANDSFSLVSEAVAE